MQEFVLCWISESPFCIPMQQDCPLYSKELKGTFQTKKFYFIKLSTLALT